MDESIDRKGKYVPVTHNVVSVGDLVLIKEDLCKPTNYPMARVKEVLLNDIGEVTGVTMMKGNREIIKRHSTCVIPFLRCSEYLNNSSLPPADAEVMPETVADAEPPVLGRRQPRRAAAGRSEERSRAILGL